MSRAPAPIVLKLGGELLESPGRLAGVVAAATRICAQGPLIVVHGGGKEIDAECARRGITKVAVDGLRVTDDATLEAVVAVLAGTINTRLVSALCAAGVNAVGLTGADAGVTRVRKAPPHRAVDGRSVDLGRVGQPVAADTAGLLGHLLSNGYVPVVACLGADEDGLLYNVNADTLASHVAVACGARELVIGGATPGVLDREGATVPRLDLARLDEMVADGTASAGMAAKLAAVRDAITGGVSSVTIADGRTADGLLGRRGTTLVAGSRTSVIG
jgi:acetylglutamate kinase